MRKDKKEIRDLLLGKAVLDEDGKLVTPGSGIFRMPQGITNGAGAVRFLGISGKKRCYETDLSEEELMEEARACMQSIGRGVRLRQQPDAAACLIRYVLTMPTLLTFRWVEGRGLLTAWAGRGLTGRISRWRAIRAFEGPMAEMLRLSSEEPPEEQKEKKRRRKRGEAPETEKAGSPSEAAEAEGYGDGYSGEEAYGDEYSGEEAYGEGEYGQREYGEEAYGEGEYGQREYGEGEYGQEEYGQGEYGQGEYGQEEYGGVPYESGGEGYGDAGYDDAGGAYDGSEERDDWRS